MVLVIGLLGGGCASRESETSQPTPSPAELKSMQDATIGSIQKNPKLTEAEKQQKIQQVREAAPP